MLCRRVVRQVKASLVQTKVPTMEQSMQRRSPAFVRTTEGEQRSTPIPPRVSLEQVLPQVADEAPGAALGSARQPGARTIRGMLDDGLLPGSKPSRDR